LSALKGKCSIRKGWDVTGIHKEAVNGNFGWVVEAMWHHIHNDAALYRTIA
jgi:hypothetical protein